MDHGDRTQGGCPPLRYVQCLAFEGCHCAVVAEAVSDAYLDDGTKLSRYEIGSLRQLDWNLPDSGEGSSPKRHLRHRCTTWRVGC